jgi:hypothetical protein
MAEDPGIPIIGGGQPKQPLDFVNMGRQKPSDKKVTPAPIRSDYHPTMIYVACTKCRSVGSIVFESGFNEKIGDQIMDGKIFKAECGSRACRRKVREMKPITAEEIRQNVLDIAYRHYEILTAWKRSGKQLHFVEEEYLRVYIEKCGLSGLQQGRPAPGIVGTDASVANLLIKALFPKADSQEEPCPTCPPNPQQPPPQSP